LGADEVICLCPALQVPDEKWQDAVEGVLGTSPAGTRNTTVDVIVTVGGQSSAISNADKFTYTR